MTCRSYHGASPLISPSIVAPNQPPTLSTLSQILSIRIPLHVFSTPGPIPLNNRTMHLSLSIVLLLCRSVLSQSPRAFSLDPCSPRQCHPSLVCFSLSNPTPRPCPPSPLPASQCVCLPPTAILANCSTDAKCLPGEQCRTLLGDGKCVSSTLPIAEDPVCPDVGSGGGFESCCIDAHCNGNMKCSKLKGRLRSRCGDVLLVRAQPCVCAPRDPFCNRNVDCPATETCQTPPEGVNTEGKRGVCMARSPSVLPTPTTNIPVSPPAAPSPKCDGPVDATALNLDACCQQADCKSPRTCVSPADNKACDGRTSCLCTSADPTCKSDADCDSGEACVGEPRQRFCVSRSRLSPSQAPSPKPKPICSSSADRTGLNLDKCCFANDCKPDRKCLYVRKAPNSPCNGRWGCRCMSSQPSCESDTDCDDGEICWAPSADQNKFCASRRFVDRIPSPQPSATSVSTPNSSPTVTLTPRPTASVSTCRGPGDGSLLTFEKCCFPVDCKGTRKCSVLQSGPLIPCGGNDNCRCISEDQGPCEGDGECEKGETCWAPPRAQQKFCVAKSYVDSQSPAPSTRAIPTSQMTTTPGASPSVKASPLPTATAPGVCIGPGDGSGLNIDPCCEKVDCKGDRKCYMNGTNDPCNGEHGCRCASDNPLCNSNEDCDPEERCHGSNPSFCVSKRVLENGIPPTPTPSPIVINTNSTCKGPGDNSRLNIEQCCFKEDCKGDRVCWFTRSRPDTICNGREGCKCSNVAPPCRGDEDCDPDGEICWAPSPDNVRFCVARSGTCGSDPTALNGADCCWDNVCKTGKCEMWAESGFTPCNNRAECHCSDPAKLKCDSDEDCDTGEVCRSLFGRQACLSENSTLLAVAVNICIHSEALGGFPQSALKYNTHQLARVICDEWGSCATAGHIVRYRGKAMCMKSYCNLVGGCAEKIVRVNSPNYRRGLTVESRTDGLVYTAFAARYATRWEEKILSVLVWFGL